MVTRVYYSWLSAQSDTRAQIFHNSDWKDISIDFLAERPFYQSDVNVVNVQYRVDSYLYGGLILQSLKTL